MNGGLSERRLVENELIARELNFKVVRGLTELTELAVAHDQAILAPDITQPLHFYCECSNIDCTERIQLSPEKYVKIHKESRFFVIAKNHQTPAVEEIIESLALYAIVEKNREPAQVVSE